MGGKLGHVGRIRHICSQGVRWDRPRACRARRAHKAHMLLGGGWEVRAHRACRAHRVHRARRAHRALRAWVGLGHSNQGT